MFYTIRHTTEFRYSAPVSQSVMEVRMQPRTEGNQGCRNFHLQINPIARVMAYRDHLGNTVHHFDVPGRHTQLNITATALVEINQPATALPEALAPEDWAEIDRMVEAGDYTEMLTPGKFTMPSDNLRALQQELGIERHADPLTTLRELNQAMRRTFVYDKQSTSVNSPIDDALRTRRGVCQDFTHIMLALVRELGIPARYVSGYLFHGQEDDERSRPSASHAWLEALLPVHGWVGFDPTNSTLTAERHIRTAIGRDYADVPPTRGVFKGKADTELAVAVQVSKSDAPLPELEPLPIMNWVALDPEDQEQQQQQRIGRLVH